MTSDIRAARQHTLGDLPRRTAQRVPDKLAIINGDKQLTFAEFEAYVERTASAIADAGLAKGDRLALLSHNCWQFAVLDFAAARAGVVLVPINFMLGPDEIAFILDHSGARAFVAEDALLDVAYEESLERAARSGMRDAALRSQAEQLVGIASAADARGGGENAPAVEVLHGWLTESLAAGRPTLEDDLVRNDHVADHPLARLGE